MEEIEVRRAWEKFIERGIETAGLKESVVESWKRSQRHDVSIKSNSAPLISEGEAYRHHSEHLWLASCAAPVLDRCAEFLSDSNSMMILTDPSGVVIATKGDDRSIDLGKEIHLQPGGKWTESAIGTNAIGTALASAQPVQIHAAEHYCPEVQKWTCAASPVFHPSDGELLGVIDISGPACTFSKQSLAFAVAAADQIHGIMARSIKLDHWKLIQEFKSKRANWLNDEVIIVDRRGTMICFTDKALKIVGRQNSSLVAEQGVAQLRTTPWSMWPSKLAELLPNSRTELLTDKDRELGAAILLHSPGSSRTTSKQPAGKGRHFDFERYFETMLTGDVKSAPFLLKGQRPRISEDTDPQSRTSSSVGTVTSDDFVADDPKVQQIVRQVERAASQSMPILIGGETGTGKELLARRAHAKSGRKGAFVPVNCAAIPANLIEAELFGYADGAFTGALRGGSVGLAQQANGGTLFLDEIGDMPMNLQAVLLRLLDDWTVRPIGGTPSKIDILLVSATNADLLEAVDDGRFRRDLFFRLNTLEVTLPPLSHRSDFSQLARHLLNKLDETREITQEAVALLEESGWRGNIRELRSVLARLMLSDAGAVIDVSHVSALLGSGESTEGHSKSGSAGGLKDMQRAHILAAYNATNGNIAETARRLSVSRNTVYRALESSKKTR